MSAQHRREHTPIRCAECDAKLVHDQRYCLDCGARRGSLPPYVAAVIATIMEQGKAVTVTPPRPVAEPVDAHAGRFDAWLGAPRAAAVAVLGMLGFGVVVGSLVSESAASTLGSVIYAIAPANTSSPSSAGAAATNGGGSAGGGGGGTITITTTTPAPPTTTTAASTSGGGSTNNATPTPTNVPPIKHVF